MRQRDSVCGFPKIIEEDFLFYLDIFIFSFFGLLR